MTRAQWLLCCLIFSACPTPSRPDAHYVCDAVAADSCSNPAARFSDLEPILKARCESCHNGEPGAPWPFDTYSNFADWSDLVRADLVTCSMPPPEASTLTTEERAQLLDWIRCGMLE